MAAPCGLAPAPRPAGPVRAAGSTPAPIRSRSPWRCAPGRASHNESPAGRPARSGTRRGRGRCCGRSCRRRTGPGLEPPTGPSSCRSAGAACSVPSTSRCVRCRAPRQSAGNSSPVRWTSQTSQPSWPLLAHFQEDRRGQHHGGGGRVVVVGPAGGERGPRAAALLVIAVGHVGRVVVVGHDDRPRPVLAGDHGDDVALGAASSWFFSQPPIQEKSKSVRHRNGSVAGQRLAGHAGRGDLLVVVGEQVVAQVVELRGRVRSTRCVMASRHAVGVVLVEERCLRPAPRSSSSSAPRTRPGGLRR